MDEQKWIDRPLSRALVYTAIAGVIYLVLLIPELDKTPWAGVVIEFGVLFLGGVFWFFFFSQFVMPVHRLRDRHNIFQRLIAYLLDFHGPALFIENGVLRQSPGEHLKKGPGIMWLDSASAALLRRNNRMTRVVGAGVVFTDFGEHIAGAIDLHPHICTLGPLESERPFDPKRELTDEEKRGEEKKVAELRQKIEDEYAALQDRRWQTRALTRDGIEVTATISVIYRVQGEPNNGTEAFPFSEHAVRQFITSIITPLTDRRDVLWSELPTQMAVDAWRDYLRRFRLIELFQVRPNEDKTALQVIGEMVRNRLQNLEVVDLDEFGNPPLDAFGNPSQKRVPSREGTVLRQMGLKIEAVTIKAIHLPQEVQNGLLSQWPHEWLKNAQRENKALMQKLSLKEREARQEALKQYTLDASLILSKKLGDATGESITLESALCDLLHGTRQGLERGGDVLRHTKGEIEEIENIRSWLREHKGESS